MYTPIMFANNLKIADIPEKSGWKDIFETAAKETDRVIPWLWYNEGLLNREYDGEFSYLNEALLKHRDTLYRTMVNEKIPEDHDDDCVLAREAVTMFLMADRWSKDKEVFSFDPELELALTDTDEIAVPIKVLDRIPYNCFYVDFAEDGIFKSNFHGVFVNIVPVPGRTGYILMLQRVKEDGRSMFGHVALIPDDGNTDAKFIFNRKNIWHEDGLDRNKDWKEFSLFILNAILYLCAENSEIKENETTKRTYRPSKTVRNKFSELRKWDCGYRFGASVRKCKADSETTVRKPSDKPRHTPVAHTRRAHWHHYWTGKNRETLILKWLPPIAVGNGEKVAVIHRKEEKNG